MCEARAPVEEVVHVRFGIAPVIGGWLNDNVTPAAIRHAGLAIGLAAAAGFLLFRGSSGSPRSTTQTR